MDNKVRGYISQMPYEEEELEGLVRYTAGVGMTGCFISAEIKKVDGGYVILSPPSVNAYFNRQFNPVAIALSSEEAERKAYEYTKKRLTEIVRSTLPQFYISEFVDETERGKTLAKKI